MYIIWLFPIIRSRKPGKDPVEDASASVPLTGTDIQADVHKGLCGINVEMIIAFTLGKLITKQQFPRAAAIPFPIARFCVCPVTKRPVLTVGADF